MSTVLRLIQNSPDPAAERETSLQDWEKPPLNAEYNSAYINGIVDPEGATAKHEITSIPSPFARIDLVKSAFKYVAENGLDGGTIFHKMVSDSLDIGEILFKYKNFSDRVKIVYWDKNVEIQKLKDSDNEGHRILGRTLETYLNQDAAAYNFDKMDGINLLVYTGNVRGECVLGATSPRTLFFSIANDLSDLSNDFQFNTDYAFDARYNPLYKRDIKYVEYLFAIRNSYKVATGRNFSDDFKEVNEYLEKTRLFRVGNSPVFVGNTQNRLKSITIDEFPDSLQVTLDNATHNVRFIQGFDLRTVGEIPVAYSDFEIAASKDFSYNGKKPLVLPVESSNQYEGWILTNGNAWDFNGKAPNVDNRAIADRTLPQSGQQYPYLTISDLLEDYIIRMPYNLNGNAYYNPEYSVQNQSFLLPLKDEFFKYFSIDDIKNGIRIGTRDMKVIEFTTNGDGKNIEVKLNIPIKKGGVLTYTRVYYSPYEDPVTKQKTPMESEPLNNRGAIVDKNNLFGFALMPAIQFVNPTEANYRFVLSSQKDTSRYDVRFYDTNMSLIADVSKSVRNPDNKVFSQNQVFAIEGCNLGYVRITDFNVSGVIVPKLKTTYATGNPITFAVDFGTTNTHIVCQTDGGNMETFEIGADDQQIQLISAGLEQEVKDCIYNELCPEVVGDGQVSKFPMRSVLLYQQGINWQQQHFALGEANFAFMYGKMSPRSYISYCSTKTDLKWDNSQNNNEMVKYYIESLFFVMRNKVLLNNSPLNTVKVYWTYPLSMSDRRINRFKAIWQQAYAKYFGVPTENNLIDINESIAPYNYHIDKHPGINNIVTIDIGGGTSDIVCIENGGIQFTASFRFAANSLFSASKPTGIVSQFLDKMKNALIANNKSQLKDVLAKLEQTSNCADIASFLFSLKENKGCENISSLDFSLVLQNDDTQKISFMFFYCAIIYHLATIMKAKGLEPPSNIGFSGNGSKVIDALTTDTRLLERITKKLFLKIYGKDKYPEDDLQIVKVQNPKEATSMGAIGANPQNNKIAKDKKIVLLGTDSQTIVPKDDNGVQPLTYQDISDRQADFVSTLTAETKKFVDTVFSLNGGNISFADDFGIEEKAINIAKVECNKRIKDKIEIRLRSKMSEMGLTEKVEETMFFYAIPDMLISLEEEIRKQIGQNN